MEDLEAGLEFAVGERDRLVKMAEGSVDRIVGVVVAHLPVWAANATKKMATDQPVVTQQLGKPAAVKLRADIQQTAEQSAPKVRKSLAKVKWPHQDEYRSEWAKNVSPHDITNLTTGAGEPMVKAVSDLMHQAGYETVDPAYKYDYGSDASVGRRLGRFSVTSAEGIDPVCEEYSNLVDALRKAYAEVRRAQGALDKAKAEDVWGD